MICDETVILQVLLEGGILTKNTLLDEPYLRGKHSWFPKREDVDNLVKLGYLTQSWMLTEDGKIHLRNLKLEKILDA